MHGRIVGYAFFGVVWNYMHLEASYVEPEYRKLGIGSAQLKKRVDIAKAMKLRKVVSDCAVGNRAAYEYHLRNGFKRCGYIRHLFGDEDSYILSKEL